MMALLGTGVSMENTMDNDADLDCEMNNMASFCPELQLDLTPSPPIVRSVAMSANIASTVREEVKHLIKVNSISVLPSELERTISNSSDPSGVCATDLSDSLSTESSQNARTHNLCSHVLPAGEDNIINAVVLSRWDDIMGPQTIRVWLPETLSDSVDSNPLHNRVQILPPRSVKGACQFTCSHKMAGGKDSNLLMKGIKYVTSHTVNYTCVTSIVTPEQGSKAFFVVPDLDMIAQSVMFRLPASGSSPYSLAVLINFSHYTHYLPFRSLCQQWLERLMRRFTDFLLSVGAVNGLEAGECPSSCIVDGWLLDMCEMLHTLRVNGLGEIAALQSYLVPVTLGLPIIERALTSHLQTAGCTIVMGTNGSEINSLISFLALFLDEEARCCSRLVRSGERDTFHMGLYLQGLLLDEFGRRDLSAEELVDNPKPVTWIDLSRTSGPINSVRQGLPLHKHQDMFSQPHSVMHVVKKESSLVRGLIRDLQHLAPHDWASVVSLFMQRIHRLALSLLSLIHWNGVPTYRTVNSSVENPMIRNLCGTLHLDQPTFLIVVAHAEQIKPGAYHLIMEGSGNQF